MIAAAGRRGVDGVEFDVRAARDGTPVVVHDADLWRVQGVDRPVSDLTVAELGELGVPDLEGVLAALPDSFFLDVELKENVSARVIPLLAHARGDPPRQTVVSSFLPEAISAVRKAAIGWPCWLINVRLDEHVVSAAQAIGCRGLAIEWPALRRSAVDLVREAGLELATWTIPDRATLRRVLALGIDAVCVDPPALPD